jgi:hypothetical protein
MATDIENAKWTLWIYRNYTHKHSHLIETRRVFSMSTLETYNTLWDKVSLKT